MADYLNRARLTVGLPLWRSRDIAWLALEGLCRQKKVNFEWELLIREENYKEEIAILNGWKYKIPYEFGREKVMEYESKLKDAGCVRIEYVGIKKPKKISKSNRKGGVHLSNKWTSMARSSSKNSLCFLLAAGDNYPQPYRLRETYDIFLNNDCDWVQSPKGIFYNFENKESLLFDITISEKFKNSSGLNMAVRTDLIRKVPDLNISRTVDSKLLKNISIAKEKSGGKIKRFSNNSEHWREGLWTHGANSISHGRWNAAEDALSRDDTFWYMFEKSEALKGLPLEIRNKIKTIDLSGRRSWDEEGLKSDVSDINGGRR